MSGAAEIAALDSRKALQMLFDAANAGDWAGDYGRVAEAIRRAAALPRSGDEGDALLTDMLIGVGSFLEGASAREIARVRGVVDRADDFDEPIWLLWAAWGAGAIGDDERAEELLRRSIALARASGTVNKLTHSLMIVALEGIFAGRCALAAEAMEGFKLARDAGLRNTASVLLAELAWFAAVKGQDDECRRTPLRSQRRRERPAWPSQTRSRGGDWLSSILCAVDPRSPRPSWRSCERRHREFASRTSHSCSHRISWRPASEPVSKSRHERIHCFRDLRGARSADLGACSRSAL